MEIISELASQTASKIVLLVLDGLGDLAVSDLGGRTPLEAARKPNLSRLVSISALGLLDPIFPGLTPGSGPAHLGLFGYDPCEYLIGRGVLEALGIGFHLTDRDVACRFNFATMNGSGVITDRRAGRIDSSEAAALCQLLQEGLAEIDGAQVFIRPVKEHRGLVVFRGDGLGWNLPDTDPQRIGVRQHEPLGLDEESQRTAAVVRKFIAGAGEILKGRAYANTVLLRGFSVRQDLPPFREIYKLRACAIATYPMYKGLASLAGMEVIEAGHTLEEEAEALKCAWDRFDFFFVHVKKTDSCGEDGDWKGKMEVIEEVDRVLLPAIMERRPEVVAVTGDHSTPCLLRSHSWHPVPLMVCSRATLPSVEGNLDFGERDCARGTLGRFPAIYLMPLLLSHAGKLGKYGA